MAVDWLFWDGECGLCRRAVAWVERRDPGGVFRAVPYQRAPRPPMTDELAARCARAMHVLTADGAMLAEGRACLYVLERIGWGRLARLLRRRPLVWAVEGGYRLVASNRRRLSGFLPSSVACGIGPGEPPGEPDRHRRSRGRPGARSGPAGL